SLPQLPFTPLGVDSDAYRPVPAVRADWRQRLGIGNADVAVLFLGRLSFHGKAHPVPMYRGLQQALSRQPLPVGAKLHLIQAGWFANDARYHRVESSRGRQQFQKVRSKAASFSIQNSGRG